MDAVTHNDQAQTAKASLPAHPIDISEYIGFACHVIRRHHYDGTSVRGCLDMEDLKQEAAIGLMYASQSFNAELSDWKTHAWNCIRSQVAGAIHKQAHLVRIPWFEFAERRRTGERLRERVLSFDAPLGDSDRTMHDLVATEEAPADTTSDEVARAHMLANIMSLAGLTEQERLVINRRFLDGRSGLADIGTDMHVTREHVRTIEAQALTKLRRAARRDGHALGTLWHTNRPERSAESRKSTRLYVWVSEEDRAVFDMVAEALGLGEMSAMLRQLAYEKARELAAGGGAEHEAWVKQNAVENQARQQCRAFKGGWRVRIRCGAGQNGIFAITLADKVAAEKRAEKLRAMARTLVAAGTKGKAALLLLRRAAAATTDAEFREVEASVVGLCSKAGEEDPGRDRGRRAGRGAVTHG